MSSADTIGLWHGIQAHREKARFSVHDIYRESDASVTVLLVTVAAGDERTHMLRAGGPSAWATRHGGSPS